MTPETSTESILVNVRRRPGDRLRADCRLADLTRVGWDYISGGRQRKSQWHVYAYVMCDRIVAGRVGHSCSHGPPPHRIKICVTRKYNEKIWPVISERVGPKPLPRKRKRNMKRKRRRERKRIEALARV